MCLVAPRVDEALRTRLRALLEEASATGGGDVATPAERLGALRRELATLGLDGLIVPHADEHLGEYMPARAQRLAWLTGFTGDSCYLLVGPKLAARISDTRYTVQIAEECAGREVEIRDARRSMNYAVAQVVKAAKLEDLGPEAPSTRSAS